MATIQENLKKIKTAVYGEEVRGAIHDSIEQMNGIVENNVKEVDLAVERADTATSNANLATANTNASAEKADTAANRANAAAADVEKIVVENNIATKDYVSEQIDNIKIGTRNLILNSASMVIDRLGSAPGSSAEFSYINVGQSYMDVPADTEVTISFDLVMIVNRANPWLKIYSLNYTCPKGISDRTLYFKAEVGETIQQRCYVTTTIFDRDDVSYPDNYLEFYSEYGSSNWYKITNLKMERGNRATDWTPAPEDLDEKINDIEFGGRNLLLDSAKQIENANYLLHEYRLSPNAPNEGEICTIQIKGNLGSDRVYFGIFNSDGGHPVVERLNTQNERGIYVATFKWTKKSVITEGEANNLTLRIYQYNNTGTSSSRIEWIKLERGNKPTDWTPAPEDSQLTYIGASFYDATSAKTAIFDWLFSLGSLTNMPSYGKGLININFPFNEENKNIIGNLSGGIYLLIGFKASPKYGSIIALSYWNTKPILVATIENGEWSLLFKPLQLTSN